MSVAIKEFRMARECVENNSLRNEDDAFYDKIAMDISAIRENMLALNWRLDKL